MKEILLNMKEDMKYNVIKKLVDTSGNKKRAALKLNCSLRTINRLIKNYKERGKIAFQHGNHGNLPTTALSSVLSNNIIHLYTHKYQGFNYQHFKEMLSENEGLTISYTALRNLLISNKLYSPKLKKATKIEIKKQQLKSNDKSCALTADELNTLVSHQVELYDSHPRQEKPKYFGEIIEMDGSIHHWFGTLKHTLHLAIDKCTNTVVGGYFAPQETLNGYYNVLNQILINYGIPSTFHTDNRTVFNYNKLNPSNRTSDKDVLTQFGYACKTLGVDISTSSIPQSKGLIERTNHTFQDRLVNELRLNNITTLDEANKYLLNVYIPKHNKKFALNFSKFNSVFETSPSIDKINSILAIITPRVVDSGNSIKFKNSYYQPFSNNRLVCFNKSTKALVIQTFDNSLLVSISDNIYELRKLNTHKTVSQYDFDTPKDIIKPTQKNKYIPPMSHPWKYTSFKSHIQKVKSTKIYA